MASRNVTTLRESVERIHKIRATLLGALSIAHDLQERDIEADEPESICRLVGSARDDLYFLADAINGESAEVQHG